MNTEKKIEATIERTKRLIIGVAIVDFVLIGLGFIAFYAILGHGELGRDESAPTELLFAGLLVWIALCMIPIGLLTLRLKKLEAQFWKETAELCGYTYVHRPYFQDSALVLQQGRNRNTGHGLMGTLNDRPFRFFQYRYTTGSGKSKRINTYCVFEVVFSGSFPHIYLNSTRNRDLASLKALFLPRMSLPAALEKDFNLHAPAGYEIEALEIFTPDLLQHLLESEWEHDLELVDQKLFVFREKSINTKQELEHELKRLQALLKVLAPKLNRMKFTQVGDLKSSL